MKKMGRKSSHKAADEASEERLVRLSSLFEASLNILVTVDFDGTITDVNKAAVEAIGVARERLIGSSFFEYVTEPEKARAECKQAFSQGSVRDYPLTIRHVSGRTVEALCNASVYRDKAGEVRGALMAISDITERKRAEEALRASEERFRNLFELSADLVCLADIDGYFRQVNKSFLRTLGYSLDEIISVPFSEFIHPEDRESTRLVIEEQVQQNKAIYGFTNRYLKKDGTIVWLEWTSQPLLADHSMVSVARNITKRKQVEAELKRVASFLERNKNPVIEIDADGKVSYMNPAARLLFPDLEEKGFRHPWLSGLRAEFARFHKTSLDNVTREVVWDELAFHQALTYISEDDRICIYGTDITELTKAQEEIFKLNKRLSQERDFAERLLQTAQAIILVLDVDGRIVRFNPYMEEVSGYRLDEVRGADWAETFLPERDRENIRQVFQGAISNIQTRGNINPIVTKDGLERVIEWYDRALKDADGNVIGLLSIGQDITEREKVDAELRLLRENLEYLVEKRTAEAISANRAKSDFLTLMSHELRTPLNSVIGFAGILLGGLSGDLNDEQKRQIEMIQSSGKQLLALVEDILDLSKIEAGVTNVELCETNINVVCREALEGVRPLVGKKIIELRFIPCAKECSWCGLVMIDRGKLTQIVLNLLSNAIKFTKAGGVELQVDCTGEETMRVRVTDTGCGIKQAALERIFEVFEQVSSSDEFKPVGAGLGLPISRKLAKLMGGDLTAKSTPGSGSEFTLELPLRFADDFPSGAGHLRG